MGVSNQLGEGRGGLRASLRLPLRSTSNDDATNKTKEAPLPRSPSSPSTGSPPKLYLLIKTAIATRKSQQQQVRQERQQAKQLRLAIETYRRKARVCLLIAHTAHPKIQDHNGVFRHRKAFTVKPNPVDGTFEAPKRLQAKRWKGSLPCIGEMKQVLLSLEDDDDHSLPSLMIQPSSARELLCV